MKWPTEIHRRRDGVAVLFAVGLTALLATGALAVDLGMLYTARGEAQRVADATALAAASSFKDFFADSATAVDTANARGLDYATNNTIRGAYVDPNNVAMEIDFNAFTATAWVRSPSLGTWFARTFGITNAVVQAKAKAWFAPYGGVKCVKPFAIPDLWDEINHDPPPTQGNGYPQDADSDRHWDNVESWIFETPSDTYEQWDPHNPNSLTATGYGSNWRHDFHANPLVYPPNDIGLQITIKAQDPGQSLGPGWFYPWRIGADQNGNEYRPNIEGCNPAGAETGVQYRIEPGNMIGPTNQGISTLMGRDPGAWWDQASQSVMGSNKGANWQQSDRVIIAALFDPNQIAIIQGVQGGNNVPRFITFNNFGLFFLEGLDPTWGGPGQPAGQAPVQARFIGFANGSTQGAGPAGPLNRQLRLIE